MPCYRHASHAGNHADVLKHAVLSLLIETLRRKEAPLCYLETHAGAGGYDLDSAYARKNADFATGISRLWGRAGAPEALGRYLGAVRTFNGGETLRRYPGSPLIAAALLRRQDRLLLCELHGGELPLLKEALRGDRRAHIHHRDGFESLKALLPPPEKRLLALIDPPYELEQDYHRVITGLEAAMARCRNGVYAIWYPVLIRHTVDRFLRSVERSGIRKVLRVELNIAADDSGRGMKGSGMLIVNPPWQFEERLEQALPWLWETLDEDGDGSFRIDWLVPE